MISKLDIRPNLFSKNTQICNWHFQYAYIVHILSMHTILPKATHFSRHKLNYQQGKRVALLKMEGNYASKCTLIMWMCFRCRCFFICAKAVFVQTCNCWTAEYVRKETETCTYDWKAEDDTQWNYYICQLVNKIHLSCSVQIMRRSGRLIFEMCVVTLLLLNLHFFVYSSMTGAFVMNSAFCFTDSSISNVFWAWHIGLCWLLHSVSNIVKCHILWTAEMIHSVLCWNWYGNVACAHYSQVNKKSVCLKC